MARTEIIIAKVTQADIDKGVPRDMHKCPVSLAVQRALGGKYVGQQAQLRPLHEIAMKFMREFDAGMKVEPVEFPVEI